VDSPDFIVYDGSGSADWTDYSLTFKFKVTDINAYVNVFFRFIGGGEPGESYYGVVINAGGITLTKNPSDVAISYGPSSQVISYNVDEYYPVRIEVSGNNVKVFFNNATDPVIDFDDDGSTYGPLQPAGTIGFGSSNSHSTVLFDDIVVNSI